MPNAALPINISSQLPLSNITSIIGLNASEVLKNAEVNLNQYINAVKIIASNSTVYITANSTVGVASKPIPHIYIPFIEGVYVVYAVFLILAFIQILTLIHSAWARLRISDGPDVNRSWRGKTPMVSVVIPVKGEDPSYVGDAVSRIVGLDYPKDRLEVIVATDDDEETAREIAEVVSRVGRLYGIKAITYRRSRPTGYKGGAINDALRLAKGDLILILDVDTILPRDYLKVALSYMERGYDVVGAPFLGFPRIPNSFSKALAVVFNVLGEVQIVGRALARARRGFYMLIGNNLLIKRSLLENIGGLCRCKGDDIDLAIRIWLRGGRIGIINMRAFTEVPSTYYAFRSQMIRWSSNDIWAFKRYINDILLSDKGLLDKVDVLIWLLKYPVSYIGLVSIVAMAIMQLFNILIPPLPLLAISIATDIAGIVLVLMLIVVGRKLGYGYRETLGSLIIGGLTMYALAFPLMVYMAKAAIGDLPWLYTPKATKALLRERILLEKIVVLTLMTVGVGLILKGYMILSMYLILNAALIFTGYRIGNYIVWNPIENAFKQSG